VLGIDPGTRHLGWGVVAREGTKLSHVAHGVIDTDLEGTLADRLVEIDTALTLVIKDAAPTAGAVEAIFFAKDAQSAAKLGHARGVVLLLLARAGVPIHEYAPALVKRTIAGRGAAEKKQVAMVVKAMLALPELPRPDAADALAIALTHLATSRFEAMVNRSPQSPLAQLLKAKTSRSKKSGLPLALQMRLKTK
jgi:crossover junction endodeoxyribonuclease RuvC